MRLTPTEARAILQRCGIARGTNFFTLDSATVIALLGEAKARGYRKSPSAPGSTGRMFHGYVNRTAERPEYFTEYEVQGCYAGAWEMVTTEETRRAAIASVRVYRDNEPSTAFRIAKKRVRVEV